MRTAILGLAAALAWACGPIQSASDGGGGGQDGGGGGQDGGGGGQDAGGGQDGGGPPLVTIQFQASCPGFTPCGGNPLGTFDYTAGCVDNPFPELKLACGTMTTSNLSGSGRGWVTYSPPGVTRDVTVTISGTAHLPASCVPVSCSVVQAGLGSIYTNPSCVAAGGGGCTCTLTRGGRIVGGATYTISGNRLTVVDASSNTRLWDICLSGNVLQGREVTSPPIEPGYWTLQKR